MKSRKRTEKLIETAKTVLLTALFFLMLALAGIYMISTQRLTLSGESSLPQGTLLMLRDAGQTGYGSGLDGDYLTPSAFAYRLGGGDLRAARPGMTGEAYSSVRGMLIYLFGSQCEGAQLSAQQGGELLSECLDGGDLIYIAFQSEIPSPLLYAYVDGGTAVNESRTAGGYIAAVREIYIMPDGGSFGDEDGCPAIALTRSEDGSFALFSSSSETGAASFAAAALRAYDGDASFYPAEFAKEDRLLAGSLLVSSENDNEYRSLPLLVCDSGALSAWEDNLASPLLAMLGCEPDRTTSYSDSEGLTYVSEGGILHIDTDGCVVYTASAAGGAPVAGVLGYGSYDGRYNFFELMRATDIMVSQMRALAPDIVGGDADIYLNRVSSSGGTLDVVYSYAYSGVPLVYSDGGAPVAVSFSFREGCIVSFNLNSMKVTSSVTQIKNYPASFAEEWIASDKSISAAGRVLMVYSIGDKNRSTAGNAGIFIRGGYDAENYSGAGIAAEWRFTPVNKSVNGGEGTEK